MSYSIPSSPSITAAVGRLAPQGVTPDDAMAKITANLKSDLGRLNFATAQRKEGSKPVFLSFKVSKSEKADDGTFLRKASYSSKLESTVNGSLTQRQEDLYAFLADVWRLENRHINPVNLSWDFPPGLADHVAGQLANMKPRAAEVPATSAAEAVPA